MRYKHIKWKTVHTHRNCSSLLRHHTPDSALFRVDDDTPSNCFYCKDYIPNYKICRGPGHDKPTLLPATNKYFVIHKSGTKAGKLYNRCRLCMNWEKILTPGLSGYVSASIIKIYFQEGIYRVGINELSRRTNINDGTIRKIINKKCKYVQKRTVQKLMIELISMRLKDEVRHKKSIKHGSAIRGRKEKIPTDVRDFNGKNVAEEEYDRNRREKRG